LKIALVTGASGFIGRVLCKQLQHRGWRVVAMMRHQVQGPWDRALANDLSDVDVHAVFEQIRHWGYGIDVIFHLASLVHAVRVKGVVAEDYFRLNVEGTGRMVELSRLAGARSFVYFSSVKAVADPGENCVDETWDKPAADVYGKSKHLAEQRVLALNAEGVHAAVIRPALVYGRGVKGNLRRMLEAIDKGRMPNVNQAGNKRSMVAVEDLVELAILVAEKDKAAGQVYFATDGERYSTKRIYETIAAALGRSPGVPVPVWMIKGLGLVLGGIEILFPHVLPVSKEMLSRLVGSACYLSDKACRELGWQPKATFESEIAGIVRHFKR